MPVVLRDLLELPWNGVETTPESAYATDVANGASEILEIDSDLFGLICGNVKEIAVFKVERLFYSQKLIRPNFEWDIFLVQRLTQNSWYFAVRQDPYARYLLFTRQYNQGLLFKYESNVIFRVYKNEITYTIITPTELTFTNCILATWFLHVPKFRVHNKRLAEEVYGAPNVTVDGEGEVNVTAVAPAYTHWLYHMIEFGSNLAEVHYLSIRTDKEFFGPGDSVDVGTAASTALQTFGQNTRGFFNESGEFDVVSYIKANKQQAFVTLGTLLAMHTAAPGIVVGVFAWNVIERQELLTKIMLDLYNAVRGDLEYASQANAVTTVDKVRLAVTVPASIAWNFGTAAIQITGAMAPTLTVLVLLNPVGIPRAILAKKAFSAGLIFVRWVFTPQGTSAVAVVSGAVVVSTIVQGVKTGMDYLVGTVNEFFSGKLTLGDLGPKIQQLYQQGSEIVQTIGTGQVALAMVGLLTAILTVYSTKKKDGEPPKEKSNKRRRRAKS